MTDDGCDTCDGTGTCLYPSWETQGLVRVQCPTCSPSCTCDSEDYWAAVDCPVHGADRER